MELPLGSESINVSFPDCCVDVARPAGGEAVAVRKAAEDAVDSPNGPSLQHLVNPDDTVAIVVTDITREAPGAILLDVLINRLAKCGIAREQVSVVVGLGLHRPMDDAEIETALGKHAGLTDNHDPNATTTLGQVEGIDIEINRTVAAADHVLATGVVEPHQYAGFSGGAKTVVIGAGGESQIGYTHGPELLSKSGVRLGRITDNPFRAFLDQAGDIAGPDFCVNITHGPNGILGVEAGQPREVVQELVNTAREALAVKIEDKYDAVIAGVGAPKDANLYQASRAATYIALGDYDPLNDGGRIVVPARLSEGVGEGVGEQRFHSWLDGAADPKSLYESMRKGYEPGAQRAFVLARVLQKYDVWITNSLHPELAKDCLLFTSENPGDAVEPGSDILIVPDAINTLLQSD